MWRVMKKTSVVIDRAWSIADPSDWLVQSWEQASEIEYFRLAAGTEENRPELRMSNSPAAWAIWDLREIKMSKKIN